MKRYFTIILAILSLNIMAITIDDIRFCLDHEQMGILAKHSSEMQSMLIDTPLPKSDIKTILEYAQRADDLALATSCHYQLATLYASLEDAMQWIDLSDYTVEDSLIYEQSIGTFKAVFAEPADSLMLNSYLTDKQSTEYLYQIPHLSSYNEMIESIAKGIIDDLSVESRDSLAISMIQSFYATFPRSKWKQAALYYHLYHLSNARDYSGMWKVIEDCQLQMRSRNEVIRSGFDRSQALVCAIFLSSPSFRRSSSNGITNSSYLHFADDFLEYAGTADPSTRHQLLYTVYDDEAWQNKLSLMKAKIGYYKIMDYPGLYGDEKGIIKQYPKLSSSETNLINSLINMNIPNNYGGEQAERSFWVGKLLALSMKNEDLLEAAKYFTRSLILGAPRKSYDQDNLKFLQVLHDVLMVETDLTQWIRDIAGYQGIVFEDKTEQYKLSDQRYTRVALGDQDNDGYIDALFNGSHLYHNIEGKTFEPHDIGLENLDANGGLWADFNRDGYLDMINTSNNDLYGEQPMKNQKNERFIPVGERAGDISDRFPTEGAAWVDRKMDGYPDLYVANYEKWQQQSGFPDYFWENEGGYFTDMSDNLGFRSPEYTHDPGQAGRGVAPADFDNDGKQEIYVTNYRLNRNFCWKDTGSAYVDVAPLFAIQGKYKNGYYGHSIGADWGDYDNDGDLDLFVANLAHPRYIDISDISILYRNDGLSCRVIDADTLYYWQFTDVTKEAGILYDELHSDPLWFDADNDGNLDLFITSVYENDRSYLYRNNGDGTFTDITWLSGCRIYNGWGNATADLNRDGKADLVIGSGNGTKVLINRTQNMNRSLTIKPIWEKGKIKLLSKPADFGKHPNSPAFGASVIVTLKDSQGKTRKLVRELSGAKGTTSQNAQELHFGIGTGKVKSIKLVNYAKDKN